MARCGCNWTVVPEGIDRQAVVDWLAAQPGMCNVHDLHIWALGSTRTALAVHLVRDGDGPDDFLEHVADELEHGFGIGHVTLQLETAPCERVGAMSMAVGEYVSVSSQSDTKGADLARKRPELANQPGAELTELYVARGVEPARAGSVVRG